MGIKPAASHWITLLVITLFLAAPLHADNKVIIKKFKWQIASSDHFDIYHYDPSGRALLPYVHAYAEDSYRRVTRFLPDPPEQKCPLFLYNTHNDFEQSSVLDVGEGLGGATEALKNRVLVGNIGSQRYLRYVVCHEYTHEAEFGYLFGGFWRSLSLVKFLVYPNWMMEGLAEYSIGDLEATTRDMYLRDAAASGLLLPLTSLASFNHVLPHQVLLAYKESEAFIRYLAAEYGEETLPALLRVYRDHADEDSVLSRVVGSDMAVLDKKFQEYMQDTYARAARGRREPSAYGERITNTAAFPRFNESAVFSPDGRSVAYIADERGIKEIYLFDRERKTAARLVEMVFAPPIENVHTDGRGISFSRDGRYLVFATEKKQRDCIALFDMNSHRLTRHYPAVSSVDSPVMAPDGKTVYFAGIRGGFRDVFSFDLETGALAQLTSDIGDDIDLCLSPDGKSLVVSSERDLGTGRMQYDLCRIDLSRPAKEYITRTECDERYPSFLPDGSIVYAGDPAGVFDLYALASDSAAPRALTAVIGGNFQPQASPDGKTLLFSSFRGGEKHLYMASLDSLLAEPAAGGAPHQASKPDGSGGDTGRADFSMQREEPLLASKSYTFRASTDLFFPFLFYSSEDGWYFTGYWQASDMLGHHQLQATATHITGREYTDYRAAYGFLKYRPQFYFSAGGKEDFQDDARTIKRREYAQSASLLYPFNRFQNAGLSFETIDRREQPVAGEWAETRTRENVAGFTISHDTVRGAYLELTAGLRLTAAAEISDSFLGGDYQYQSFAFQTDSFIPLGREHTLLWRSSAWASYGPDAEAFSLGGIDRLRGIPSTEIEGNRTLVNTFEWRFPLAYNLNYDMNYFIPEFFFKSLYGGLFMDAGFSYNDDAQFDYLAADYWKASVGMSLRCHTFVIQIFPLLLTFQCAWRLDQPAPVTYFSAGSRF